VVRKPIPCEDLQRMIQEMVSTANREAGDLARQADDPVQEPGGGR
jgi:hypothetical protein